MRTPVAAVFGAGPPRMYVPEAAPAPLEWRARVRAPTLKVPVSNVTTPVEEPADPATCPTFTLTALTVAL